jgi:hypothetical protein
MKAFTGPSMIFDLDPFSESSVKEHAIGQVAETQDGRKYRYSWMGEEITVGRLATGPAINTNLDNMAVLTGAAKATRITFTNASTTTTAKYFDEGFALVTYATGGGQTLKIKSLPALVSAAASYVDLEDPIVTALDTTSKLSLVQNPNSQVLMTATATLTPVGVSAITFTTQYYGWLQTHGVCAVHSDNTIVAGTGAFNDGSEAGAVDIATEASYIVNPLMGRAYQLASASGYWTPFFLMID